MKNALPAMIALVIAFVLLASPAAAGKEGKRRGTPAEAQAMVARAVALFERDGAEAAFDRFNNRPAPEFRHADLYIFVAKAQEGARIVAHAQTRSLVGTDAAALIDPGGLNIGRAVLANAKPGGAWVDYGWKDPLTGEIMPKSSWVVLHGGYIFGCGVHRP